MTSGYDSPLGYLRAQSDASCSARISTGTMMASIQALDDVQVQPAALVGVQQCTTRSHPDDENTSSLRWRCACVQLLAPRDIHHSTMSTHGVAAGYQLC